MDFLITIILIFFIFVCFFLIFLVLVQTSKGGSLFGIGDSTQSVFGTSTVDVLTKATRIFAILFMCLSLMLSYLFAKKEDGFIQQPLEKTSVLDEVEKKTEE